MARAHFVQARLDERLDRRWLVRVQAAFGAHALTRLARRGWVVADAISILVVLRVGWRGLVFWRLGRVKAVEAAFVFTGAGPREITLQAARILGADLGRGVVARRLDATVANRLFKSVKVDA